MELGDLRKFIEESLEFWKVPGVAVGIVKDGEVILAEGFGYKDLENKKKMTADTVLPIGSATKSFTAMAAAILIDEEKMTWDTPINEYIPGFKMFDPVASANVNIRDMLCHRTGLPRHDLMWAGGTGLSFTREDLIRRVRYLENNAGFREKSQYQNHMLATVGHAVEKVSGKSWEDFVKEKIFKPLGMNSSNFHVADSQKAADHGMPYRHDLKNDFEIKPAEFMELGAPGPAGSINSTVNDMTNWIKLMLGKGAFTSAGKEVRVVSEERVTEMLTPQMHISLLPWEFPEHQFLTCGMGWFLDIYRGHRCFEHGGNVTGFTALVSMMPDQNMGICILANMNSTFINHALVDAIYDRVLGAEKTDWNERYFAEIKKLLDQMQEGKDAVANSRVEGTKPSLDSAAYEGVYEHPGYGTLTIVQAGEEYDVDFNGNKLRLKHQHYDQFLLCLDRFEYELPSRFTLNAAAQVESISVPFEGALGKDIVFTKKAEEKAEENA